MRTQDSAQICPWCQARTDAVAEVTDSGDGPGPGDLVVCATCTQVGIMTHSGNTRLPTEQEQAAHAADPVIKAARTMAGLAALLKGRRP